MEVHTLFYFNVDFGGKLAVFCGFVMVKNANYTYPLCR